MAFEILWLQELLTPARWDRILFDSLYTEGVLDVTATPTALKVTPSALMVVSIASGVAAVAGDDQANQGKYLCKNTAAYTVALDPAPGANSRYDLIYLQVRDPNAAGSAGNDFVIAKSTGVVSGAPVVPATPASAVPLAKVLVATGTLTITTPMITDLRVEATLRGSGSSSSSAPDSFDLSYYSRRR